MSVQDGQRRTIRFALRYIRGELNGNVQRIPGATTDSAGFGHGVCFLTCITHYSHRFRKRSKPRQASAHHIFWNISEIGKGNKYYESPQNTNGSCDSGTCDRRRSCPQEWPRCSFGTGPWRPGSQNHIPGDTSVLDRVELKASRSRGFDSFAVATIKSTAGPRTSDSSNSGSNSSARIRSDALRNLKTR